MQFENKMGFKNKKNLFLIIFLVILILLGAGFFYWWEFYETPVEKWDEAKYSRPEDYEVIETDKGVFVQNKKAGLSFMVPDGWRVEKEKEEDHVALFSPFVEGTLIIKNGCKITIEIKYLKAGLRSLEGFLRKVHKEWGYIDEYEIVSVDEYQALRNTTGIASLDQFGIGVHVPIKSLFSNKLFYLGLSSNLQDRDDCFQEFEEFLKTVSIK